jgi:hypothetical protein
MGEHNDRVFGDLLGMSPEAMSKLSDDGVTGTKPLF